MSKTKNKDQNKTLHNTDSKLPGIYPLPPPSLFCWLIGFHRVGPLADQPDDE